MQVCPSCGDENSDRARFCQSCATPLTGPSEPLRQTRKVVTVVFADVSGSTALGERLDPEALRRVMGRFFDEMEVVIGRHGGTVEKFIGDAVMAVFGIPRLHEDDAVRAVRAAAEMRDALGDLNVDLATNHGIQLGIRIGVNTGEVVAGDAAGDQRLVTGDAVNVAARLEQAAPVGDALLGETTYRLVKDAVEAKELEPLELKGKADGVRAYRLVSVRDDTPGHERRLDAALVGREAELQLLHRALERAVGDRRSHLFTLLGPAGVGKSRLVQEFIGSIASSATILRGRCLSYGEGITFFPLTEVIQQACGIEESDAPAAANDKLTSFVANAPDGERIAPLVAGLIGWSQPGAIEDAFWAVRKLFEHLARERELVVVFDDIHWGEQTFLDLLDHLADWTRDAAVLLLCVARPELLDVRPLWAGGKLNATSILLEPLSNADASKLLDTLLAHPEVPSEVRHRILEAAEGNPLFVEEMAAMLMERDVTSEAGRSEAGDLLDVSVPPTIQLLLAARLDALETEERAVIERGAVEGNVFHTGAVTTLAPERLRSEVSSRLLALTRKELIRPDRPEFAGQDAFRFRHLLIRDAAYQALPKEVRGELHERFALWLERAAGDRIVEYEEIVAHHFEQAYRSRIDLGPAGPQTDSLRAAAAERLLRSAERANDRGDFSGARGLIERAVELSDARLLSRALLELALTLSAAFDFRKSTAVATEAMAAAEESGDRVRWLRARLVYVADMGQIDPAYTVQWSLSESRTVLEELVSLGDEVGIVEAKLTVASHLFYLGDGGACRDMTLPLLSRASGLPFKQRRAIVTNVVIPSYFGPTRSEEALAVAEESHRLLSGSLISEVNLAAMRAALFGMMGRAQESRVEGRRVKRLWDEIGNPNLRLTMHQFLGEAERFLGRPDLAEQEFREGVEGLSASGETGWNSTMTALLALSLCDQERFDEAEEFVIRSRELGAEDDFATQITWRMALARIESHRNEHARAFALADDAVALGEGTDYIAWQAEAHDVRGRVLLAAGRPADAREAFATSLERYERKGVVPAIERLRARLETLQS